MKIAYIANSRFPSERAQSDHVMAMCSAFAEQGHEVGLFVPDRKSVLADDPFLHYGKTKNFLFRRVKCLDALRYKFLGSIGLWIQTLTFVGNLSRELKDFAPDVVYSRELYVFYKLFPGRNIWEAHFLPKSWWAKKLIKKLDGVVTLTERSKTNLVGIGIASEKVSVEPDAVDPRLFENSLDRFSARQKLGVREDEFLCLYTGKFTTMGMPKGLEEAVEAIRRLRLKDEKIRLLAVGGTPEELSRFKSDLGFEFIGHQPQRELKNYYAAADLLLMPFPFTEHYAYYMSPLKLFEYLMSGVPMVVTDLPSVREIVSEKEAFFAKPGDVESLKEQINFARSHMNDAIARAQAAKTIAGRYTWDKRAERIAAWVKNKI